MSYRRRPLMENLSVYLVFAEGIASFLSPCLLPLLPVYIGYLSGEITGKRYNKRILIFNSIMFCTGLSVVFVLMGITASSIGMFLNQYKYILTKAAAVVIILFGLFHMGIIKFGFLYRERRFNFDMKKTSLTTSFIFGMAFAFGWTPCIGPILSSVLFLAGSSGSAAYGAYLLLIYALGLSIPFIITAALMEFISAKIKALQKYSNIINAVSGGLLVVLGIALYSGWLYKLYYI
jgi:Cytochrome c biogenesis protein